MRVLTSGYWNNNLGDDLFLKILSERYPKHQFYIMAGGKGFETLKVLKNVHQIHIPFYIKLLNCFHKQLNVNPTKLLGSFQANLAKEFDAFCEIGGSLFILPSKGMGDMFDVRNLIIQDKNLPYFVIGSNFGPFYHKYQIKKYAELFERMTAITFRDTYSYQLFPSLNNITYAPDVVFNLDISPYETDEEYTLVSIINPRNRFNSQIADQYFSLMNKIVNELLDNNEKVVLMSFCDAEGDLEAANRIKNNINRKNISVYSHHNIEQSLEIISHAKQIIAARYHSMILAWLFHKPTFVMSYSNKINQVTNDVFPSQPMIDIKQSIGDFSKSSIAFAEAPNLTEVRKEALHQFEELDKLLQ